LHGNQNSSGLQCKSGVLTSNSSRQRSAVNALPLLQRTDFGPAVCS